MAFSTDNSQREAQFNSLVSENRQLICKVCYMYATDVDYFNDLYQETLANIWSAMDSFRGEARISTWLYRIAINSCVTFFRRHHRHDSLNTPIESLVDIPGDDGRRTENLREMYRLIAARPDGKSSHYDVARREFLRRNLRSDRSGQKHRGHTPAPH